uniref:Uncharacterized protein n=1 Tax=Craspedostauros australis TaxID=1486917 RepID=A0A7R9WT13_9STRA|mmetsp:Transcript_19608/g.54507  ORF Transcript_19608/g.54507 Transcript_19608/m.54507 type:complete len:472 (+) Transcript_19608:206-1621(+)|eukprot:CAMPEP_0198117624 /NCGR_PEP_ID=MMETSP1442-20131203/18705_1 /TAXON_ID= /ORGANISM="Craspedostauros australis, Strain CCMP3328" /LENGTH=471 /DNA_ID=CAMNT_0043775713 /DNA_START=71 /DNA_END=1486 /DNA_ORIENTATION=+
MTLLVAPEFAIIWGPRSVMSLIGIIAIFAGFWRMEKKWDDHAQNVEATASATGDVEMNYAAANDASTKPSDGDQAVPQQAAPTPAPAATTTFTMDDQAVPPMIVGGFMLWAISSFLSPDGTARQNSPSFVETFSVAAMLTATFILTKQYQFVTVTRNLQAKEKIESYLMASVVLFAILQIFNPLTDTSPIIPILGAFFIIISCYLLWRNRKMGRTWDREGKANPDYVVQSYGAPGLVIGLYFLWLGSNTVAASNYSEAILPIYVNERSLIAVVAVVCFIIPATLARDYAFDQGSKVEGFGLDGSTFSALINRGVPGEALGAAIEGPLFYILGWTLFGLSAMLPFDNGYRLQQLASLLGCVAVSILDARFVQLSFYNAEATTYETLLNGWYLGLAILAVVIGLDGGTAIVLSIMAVAMIALGRKLGMEERKKGDAWVTSQTVNEQPTVYGMGIPLYTAGLIVLSLAMSIPMN